MSTKNRIFYYDALRALAIIGIVCTHVAANFAAKSYLINTNSYFLAIFFNHFRNFAVPIFVMLSGALLLNRDLPPIVFLKKRFNRVVVPLIFWTIIFGLFSIIFLHFPFSIDTFLKMFFVEEGTLGGLFWFIWMIIVVYIWIFIINKIFSFDRAKKYFSTFVKLSVIALVIYSIIVTLDLFSPPNKLVHYSQFIGYALLGYYLANTDFTKGKIANFLKLTPLKLGILSLILFIGLYLTYISGIIIPTSVSLHEHFSTSHFYILLIILNSSLFLSFRYLSESNNGFIKKIESGKSAKLITSISRHSFGIYFIHMLIIYLINIITKYQLFTKNPMKVIPLLIVVVFLSSWFIIWCIDKIPYANKCLGTS